MHACMQALQLLSTPKSGLASSLQALRFEGFVAQAGQLGSIPLLSKLRSLSLNHTTLMTTPPAGSSCCAGMCSRCARLFDHATSAHACAVVVQLSLIHI